MDSVPLLFVESVSASLSKDSTYRLKDCRSAVWKVGAEHIWTVMKDIDIQVLVPRMDPLYGCLISERIPSTMIAKQRSIDDLRRIRFAWVYVNILPRLGGPEASIKSLNALFSHVSSIHVERLRMQCVRRIDSRFQNFFPNSVNRISTTCCTFGADSVFPEWLRRILRSNSLHELSITSTNVEGRIEDVEEDLIHQSFMHGKPLEIYMTGNQNFTNLNAKFFRKVLDLWINSETPFPREISYLSNIRNEEMRTLRRECFNGKESLLHKSRNGKVIWEIGSTAIKFTRNVSKKKDKKSKKVNH
uniref:FBA_2 domain-containing protein n=1 Tax=Steinernema glaseri TaxID=37863 RepID=A0A1I7YU82_9BILA